MHDGEALDRDDVREEEMDLASSDSSPYQVKLEAFEGPLDLLLHLIKINQINIADIPMALITRQYLDYLGLMKSLNLNVAGEFLVMASTLIHIKSKLLLPVQAEEEEELGDPREELVRRLVEYKRFKDAAERFENRELLWRDVFRRTALPETEDGEDAIAVTDLSLFDLLDAFRQVLERIPEKRNIDMIVDELSVKDRMAEVRERLERESSLTFESLFDNDTTRDQVILTFLAVLELIRVRLTRVEQGDLFGPIRLVWRGGEDATAVSADRDGFDEGIGSGAGREGLEPEETGS